MGTNTLILTDLLNCGYADLDMLDILYSELGDEIDHKYSDRISMIKSCDFNDILYQFYDTCNNAIRNKVEELLENYKFSLNEGKATDYTTHADLVRDIDTEEIFYPEGDYNKFKPLKKKQIKVIEDKLAEMEEQYPYTNYIDSHFGTDLDETLDEDYGVKDNAIRLIKYWLKY